MKFLVIFTVFCAAVVLAEKQQPNQQNLQLSPSNLPVNPSNVKPQVPAQVPTQSTTGPIPSNLVDVKRIVDHVSTHLPRIFTWRSWNHWLDSNTNKLKQSFDIVSGEGIAFADKSFVLAFRTGSDASDTSKPLPTSSWKAPTEKCDNCRFKGLLIFDADSRPVGVLLWQAADKQFVRTYNANVWTAVETAKFGNWFRFIQKSLDQNAPKITLPLSPLAPDQLATSTTTDRTAARKDSRRA